jgi:eukaryotic-like serine/threonine-protein kinase
MQEFEQMQSGSHESSGRARRMQRLAAALPARYVFQRELGEGGAAHVLLAEDSERGHLVAVKILRPEVATDIGERRFQREIEIVRGFKHPNILPLLDYGMMNGRIFFTTPYIAGDTLKARIKNEGFLSLADTVAIMSDIAAALDHAHTRGIIHRDVKPANILLAETGTVVADFGIARGVAFNPAEALTVSGVALGTPEYMSPEQCGGMRELDARCDVYSLGCVAYEMLTGGPPFAGSTNEAILARHFKEIPRPITEIRPSIPDGVDRAIAKSLAKIRAHRYYSAGEFFDAVDAAARA